MQGELFILGEAVLWSLFPIFTKLSYTSIPPLYAAAISTFFAALFFAVILTIKKRWHEVKRRDAWKDIALVTIYIGVIVYSLVFIGLKFTTAGNSALIGILEVFFSFLILGMLKKEKMTRMKVGGAVLMAFGAMFVLLPKASSVNIGDFILIGAQAFAPLGNLAQQSARKKVSSSTIMFLRSLFSSGILFLMAIVFSDPLDMTGSSFIYLIINGVLFMGLSKLLWIEGIHRTEITRANSINMIIPFFTIFFAYLMLKEIPSLGQMIGIVPMLIGAVLILRKTASIESVE
ncbi:MAG: DMT family transporter [Candidatus Woesearchaeota archaeon]|nr:DMT family transporter [Candidatus Woesearchaeota archaeon]